MKRQDEHSSRRNAGLRWLSRVFLTAGAVVLASGIYIWADAHVYQALESQRFDPSLPANSNGQIANCKASAKALDSFNSSIGRLEIPRLGLSVVVLEGDGTQTLRRGAGHIPGSAWAGHAGNLAIAGHRDTFFRGLRDIRKDDVIQLTTLNRSYVYRVDLIQIVESSDMQVLDKTAEPVLTLITCFPFSYIGPAPSRFVVRARQVSSSAREDLRECQDLPQSADHQSVDAETRREGANSHN
jgi:sortase A